MATAALAYEAQARYLESVEYIAEVLSKIVEDPDLFLQYSEEDKVAPVVLEFLEKVSGPEFQQLFDSVDDPLQAGMVQPIAFFVERFVEWRRSASNKTPDERPEPSAPSTPRGETSASALRADEQFPQTASPPQKKRKRPSRKTEPEPVVTRSSRGGRSVSTSEGGRLTRSGRGGAHK